MINKFPNIKIDLMVGIGGELPHEENNIRLSDVVISKPDGQYSGVMQYNLGKFTKDGFKRTSSLNTLPEKLLAMLNIIPHHSTPLKNRPLVPYPIKEFDQLYNADYQHISDNTCKQCNTQQWIERDPDRRENRPLTFYRIIASGNNVIRDTITRDTLIAKHHVLYFKIEAAGLMNSSFPCLVIREISDYADSHKNDK